jgi:hypothetical protein
MIYLYIKTHNVTGLKYLGKTTSKDPHRYLGSGTRWRSHLAIHGFDYSTEILFQSSDSAEIKEKGIYYSQLWDIVDSNHWANLKQEEGDGGFCKNSITPEANAKRSKTLKGRTFTTEHCKNLSIARKGRTDRRSQATKEAAAIKASAKLKGKKKPEGFSEKISAYNKGKTMSADAKSKMRESWTLERRLAQSERTKLRNLNRPILICPHCSKSGTNAGSMRKYHFENCKVLTPEIKIARIKQEIQAQLWTLCSPNGDFITVTNMRAFCRDNSLNNGAMTEVTLGNRKHHKGWTVISRS